MSNFRAFKVAENVYWVGAIDWTLRDFHGYATHRGSTYNAFLILADKITLIDTVKAPFVGELMDRIASVVDPKKIEVVISNHTEMDHSGCLPQVLDAVQPEVFIASAMGEKALRKHFPITREIKAVKDGETFSLGNKTVAFVETRMLHWPDSMFTYLADDRILFSSDAFGMHLASDERFTDEVPEAVWMYEQKKYFANILLLYAPLILRLVEKVQKLGIPIDMICPDHGTLWRKDPLRIVQLYAEWAEQKPTRKAVIAYDTMWHSTEAMARAIEEGLVEGGATTKVMSLKANHRSDVATEILDAGALIVGSPTLNNGLFPTLAELLTYLTGLKPKNLVGAAFGSYGWSGEAVKRLTAWLGEMGVRAVGEGVTATYVPTAEDLARCRELGRTVAKALVGR